MASFLEAMQNPDRSGVWVSCWPFRIGHAKDVGLRLGEGFSWYGGCGHVGHAVMKNIMTDMIIQTRYYVNSLYELFLG